MPDKRISLAGHSVVVSCEDPAAQAMLDFMFEDVQEAHPSTVEARYAFDHSHSNSAPIWSIRRDNKSLYQNTSLTDTANFLMGEVLFDLISRNDQYMAIHAALLSDAQGGILLPGESGNGKSSLAIWMTLNGYQYHTDELVLIPPGSLQTRVFTRPFNIKSHGIDAIDKLIDIDQLAPAAARGDFITMIPHRALNPDFDDTPPEICRIVFPSFDRQAQNNLMPLSPAAAGIELMKTNVIARNLPSHGFDQLLDIIKAVPAYKLSYRHFDALPALIGKLKEVS